MPRSIKGVLDRLSESEDRFLTREFLAPVVCGRKVRVAIDGVNFELSVRPRKFQGWGVFRPDSHRHATLVREGSLLERRKYLDLLPIIRMILCVHAGDRWLAVAADANTRISVVGSPPVEFVENAERFQTVRVRFDGATFLFDGIEHRCDPRLPRVLNQAIERGVAPDDLQQRGLTAQHRVAYTVEYARRAAAQIEKGRDDSETALRTALEHAGGSLEGFATRGDGYRVTWRTPDGQQHVSAVDRDSLTVRVAGICLDGHDQLFDLASLVGVYQEAERDAPWAMD